MFCTEVRIYTARKVHRCTYCGEPIEIGTKYERWLSVDCGKGFSNKMHYECATDACDDSGYDFEYEPFHNERPKVALTTTGETK